MKSSLLTGHLMHSRRHPVTNHFTYPVYNFLIHLDELPVLPQRLRLFSYNCFNVVSIHDADHWHDPTQSIKANLFAYLARQGVSPPDGDVYMLANARIWGYVFDPITVFYCYHKDGRLALIVTEVHNTKGERFPYLLDDSSLLPPTPREQAQGIRRYGIDKQFYVSPLIPMAARYELAFSPIGGKMFAHIDEFHQDEKFFQARLWGDLRPLTSKTLRRVLWRYPLMTLQVKAYIYWQAVKVHRQGVPLLPKPAVPPEY